MRSDLVGEKVLRNRETRELSESFAGHRQKVMRLIEATAKDLSTESEGRLSSVVLIGPGNCLDIDLNRLTELFDVLHFVDVDEAAVREAVAAAGLAEDRVRLHVPEDIADPLLSLTSRDFRADSADELANVLQHLSAEHVVPDVPEADVVVSLCVLSQLYATLVQLIPENHIAYANALRAIRIGHLRRLMSMLRRGGVGILVTDVVSSETAEELSTASESSLAKLLPTLIESGNFFSGANPSSVLNDLNMLNRLPDGPESVHSIDPWLWHLGDRTYAVYALRVQKKLPVTEETPDESERS